MFNVVALDALLLINHEEPTRPVQTPNFKLRDLE